MRKIKTKSTLSIVNWLLNLSKYQFSILLLFLCLCSSAIAQNVITFTWQVETGNSEKVFGVDAPIGETITVNWGDGTTPTTVTINEMESFFHTYAVANSYSVTITGDVTYLEASYCFITSLDISKNMALTMLSCIENSISVLNLSKNTALLYLDCSGNSISGLDLSKNTALLYLNCGSNSISVLDVSKNTALTSLFCYNNSITGLDLSKNTELSGLNCAGNSIGVLDVSKNTALQYLDCHSNHLPLSELFKLSEQLKGYVDDGTLEDYACLGWQTLPPMTVKTNTEQFADQSAFGGKFTEYAITPATGYTITNGKLTFTKIGVYEVTMTNAAILSNTSYPADVSVKITVTDTGEGIEQLTIDNGELKIYPNPTTGQLHIGYAICDNAICDIVIYDIMGRRVMTIAHPPLRGGLGGLDVSSLPSGVYFLKIGDKTAKFVKQ